MVKVHLRISPDTAILHRNMSPLCHSQKLATLMLAPANHLPGNPRTK